MRRKRTRWIRKLFIDMDPALILSLNNIYGKEAEKMTPRSLYRKAKKMWLEKNPEVKNWGKPVTINSEKTKTEGVNND